MDDKVSISSGQHRFFFLVSSGSHVCCLCCSHLSTACNVHLQICPAAYCRKFFFHAGRGTHTLCMLLRRTPSRPGSLSWGTFVFPSACLSCFLRALFSSFFFVPPRYLAPFVFCARHTPPGDIFISVLSLVTCFLLCFFVCLFVRSFVPSGQSCDVGAGALEPYRGIE